MKKIVCFTLTVLLLLIGVSLNVWAAENADVTVMPAQTTVHWDETVTFTVRISGCDAARSIGIIPRYDSEVFEYVSGEWLLTGAFLADFSDGVATIAFVEERAFNENVLTFTLKVKNGAVFDASSVTCEVNIMNLSDTIDATVSSASVKIECSHDYSDWSSTDAAEHTRTCSICGETDSGAHDYANNCDDTCDLCGQTRTIEHSFRTTWSSDQNGHWHVCRVCGVKTDEAEHIPGPEATESSAQTCTVCGYVINEKIEHIHQPIGEWEWDANTHWRDCQTCSDRAEEAEHTYDNACDTTCNDCGAERTIEHSFRSSWKSDETGHWHVCRVCGEKDEVVPHIPGAEATETTPQLCTECNYEIAPIAGHRHSYTGEWFSDADGHWQVCSCGITAPPTAHQWGEGTVDKAPTATEVGQKTYTCTECAYSKTVELEMVEVTVTVTIPAETVETPVTTTPPETEGVNEEPPKNDPDEDGVSKLGTILIALLIGVLIGAVIGIPLAVQNRRRYYESILESIADETDSQS